ncbi:serine/threonine protein phosphatase PrpC [Actinoplanes lutulentus]|nr:serine/threonine protein phosphatase PrpC [Actinoplanes lutulentus]
MGKRDDVEEVADELVAAALSQGGLDNVTVIVMDVVAE